jgi:hypothetical protein
VRLVPLDDVFDHVATLARMRPRGRGFGVKGSSHVVFWPSYYTYRLGVLLGMLYGDGNLIKRNEALRTGRWRIEFCEGDGSLVGHYAKLAHDLFNVKPTVRKRGGGGWEEAYSCCRIVYEFLTFAGEHPNGVKAGKLHIPELAHRSQEALRGFISGLFSVEGSPKGGRYPRMTIEMMEPRLIPEIREVLRKRGFNPHLYSYPKNKGVMYGVYLYGETECDRFLREIGLLGKREQKLRRFLRSRRPAPPARKQPGGGTVRRL